MALFKTNILTNAETLFANLNKSVEAIRNHAAQVQQEANNLQQTADQYLAKALQRDLDAKTILENLETSLNTLKSND